MNPTIKEVAKHAGVSIATVSRILNNTSMGYSDKTKEKVLKVAKEIGYRPNAIARGLINKRTQTIGVLFPELSGMVFSEMLQGIENAANELGQSVIVTNTDKDGIRTMKYLQLMSEKQVDGIIFTSEVITEEYYELLKEIRIPTILISSKSTDYPIPYVKVDDQSAAYTATEYLIKKGHKHIGMISGSRNDLIAGIPRVNGFKQALEDYRLQFNDNHIVSGEGFSFTQGVELLPLLIQKVPNITAIFAASDEIAIGAIAKANEMGINVPDQLSIIGYDNIELSNFTIPSLTTIHQPFEEMGKMATRMLVDLIQGESIENCIIDHQIIERHSVSDLKG